MDSEFNQAFANFLEEQAGEAIAKLREGNEKYRLLLQEREILVKTAFQGTTKSEQIFEQFVKINHCINEIEGHYLLLTGMRLQKQIHEAIVAQDFYEEFV